jgi:hypothetical protein
MTRRSWTGTILAVMAAAHVFVGPPARAQSEPQAKPAPPSPAAVKVDVTLTRLQGEKRVSSLPFTLFAATDNSPTSFRLGVDVPVDVSTKNASGIVTTETRYENVGTNIDIRLRAQNADGRYPLWIQITDSSIHTASGTAGRQPSVGEPQAIRRYVIGNQLMVREGQPVEFSVGTDKVTGETIRAEVRIAILK